VNQSDSAAAAAREAAPGDTGLGASRGSLGVTWGEVRFAVWLSLACAVTAALLGVPSGAAYFFINDLSSSTLGKGSDPAYAFRDATRMLHREPYTIDVDYSTWAARWSFVHFRACPSVFSLFAFPVCYVAYLGASLKVCCSVLGSAVLAYTVASAGYVITGNDVFIIYSPALGFALLLVALKLICPRTSRIPRHALTQLLVFAVGNVVLVNVIRDRTVRIALTLFFER
jgi:hypothetical protein